MLLCEKSTFILGTVVGFGVAWFIRKQQEKSLKDKADAFMELIGLSEYAIRDDLNEELSEIATLILQYTYDKIDFDRTGSLSIDDLKAKIQADPFCKLVTQQLGKCDLDALIENIDYDGDRHVSLGEFLSYFEKKSSIYHHGCLTGIHNLPNNDDKVCWGYTGVIGPSNWHRLSRQNVAALGHNQSPINVLQNMAVRESSGAPVAFKAKQNTTGTLLNNGHTICLTFDESGATLDVGKLYHLRQFHFHSPSEHLVDGQRYPLELHLVHIADDNSIAVIGVLFRIGEPCEFLDQFLDKIPALRVGQPMKAGNITVNGLGINENHVFRYTGSLTTPPCSENVKWNLISQANTCSQDQLLVLRNAMPLNNYRPVQPINGRVVTSIARGGN
uniref:Carbonic anhydrase n=1 Tax=Mucochytrium quahogii TaxID=96639 RepID=A0A7S2WNU0_9STRA|mmetsp:Transcript_1847/g.2782  ORF Transcript_1847/g.2782 Transcript_1847/m.2782 type:complete len:387 (+) Transcript_1847:743-1903(+)|eukprot:CAMPEP_0203749226 /NCGR_PEP_ID=MMETSP0098-20131031/3864_1 /ASSEMBLY_ACC=CAM_ASM_000208 /TAXON_ID=96639 /ORGANISM=" , Strain NY0313808BC1" /LENGTH=386 /DNA_ID=CAMNT_0050638219 /DNA_START=806 /DNA_END=1966 /DNA_ORIENTATION=-